MTATGAAGAGFCNACLTGDYPVEVPVTLRKDVLEAQPAMPAAGELERISHRAATADRRRPMPARPTPGPASTSPPARRPSSASRRWCAPRSGPRSSATSAASAACSPSTQHRYRQAGARVVDRRGRHQGADRPGRRPLRHHRHRPGGHVRRRPRVPGGRAAVLPRLHRGRQARPRPHRAAREGRGRGLPAGRLRADRRRDGRAPRRDGARRVRPGRASPSAWSSATGSSPASTSRPGDVLIGLPSPGLRSQRLLAGPPRPARAGRACRSTTPPSPAPTTPRRRAAAAVGDLRPGRARPLARVVDVHAVRPHHRRRHPRQPGAALPAGADAVVDRRRGSRRGSSARSSASARSTTTRWRRCSTSASA